MKAGKEMKERFGMGQILISISAFSSTAVEKCLFGDSDAWQLPHKKKKPLDLVCKMLMNNGYSLIIYIYFGTWYRAIYNCIRRVKVVRDPSVFTTSGVHF